MADHLTLPFYASEFERRKPRAGHAPKERADRKSFTEVQVFNLANIQEDFEKNKPKYQRYFDPNLIFRIVVNQGVSEDDFVKFLERAGLGVITSSPSGSGYWISLAEDDSLDKVKGRLREYGDAQKYKSFDAVESFSTIPPEEKVGEGLRQEPLKPEEEAYLDIEVWKMEEERLTKFLAGFEKLVEARRGKITDKLVTENLCLLRAKVRYPLFSEISQLREISRIDRPPKPYITWKMLAIPLASLNVEGPPDGKATVIAVLDSGILSNHPLLEKAVADEISVPSLGTAKIKADKPQDDVGHGTEVAGVALYGDIKKCIEDKKFAAEVWILSAKVMFAEKDSKGNVTAVYDESELLEHQLEKAVTYCVGQYERCRVVNISFGDRDKKMFGNKRQYPLATLIDELAKKYGVVFVVSAGNIDESISKGNQYPQYLISEQESVKIIDPASSAYALTVGSIAQDFGPLSTSAGQIAFSPAEKHYPSPFTCAGPGYRGMIKPDLVEEGGNVIVPPSDPLKVEDFGGKLVVLNPDFISEGKLFSAEYGTSFSAAKVSHFVAKLFNAFPNASANLIKALLLSSAAVPLDRPGPLKDIKLDDSDKKLMDILKVYGHGKPNLDRAVSSESNRVALMADGKIKPDSVHLYYFYLPSEFANTHGTKEISVCLVYDPPIRRNRIDYMGINMEFHLIRDSDLGEVSRGYKAIKIERELDEIVPEELKVKEIDLHPGVRLRKRGIHHKGTKTYLGTPQINPDKPLVLAVISQNRWVKEEDYVQNYAVVVTVKHQGTIDLYNLIKQRIEIEERVRLRA